MTNVGGMFLAGGETTSPKDPAAGGLFAAGGETISPEDPVAGRVSRLPLYFGSRFLPHSISFPAIISSHMAYIFPVA